MKKKTKTRGSVRYEHYKRIRKEKEEIVAEMRKAERDKRRYRAWVRKQGA